MTTSLNKHSQEFAQDQIKQGHVVRERRHWDDYQRAFDSMLSHTSTQWAPWYVAPADHRWFSHLASAGVLVTALNAINPRYPAADPAERDRMAQVRAELVAELGATQPG